MRVLKFGGTSMGDAKLLIRAAEILEDNAKNGQVITVLSSPTKITTYLTEVIKNNLTNKNILLNIKHAEYIFSSLLLDLVDIQPKLNFGYLKSFIGLELNKIKKILYGIRLLKQCPDNIYASVVCVGGKIAVVIMEEILKVRHNHTSIINPVTKLFAFGSYLNSTIDIIESIRRIKLDIIPNNNIILMAGSIAGNENGEIVLLGNNGSNYSAAVLAACFNADICEIWTDVDGIHNCDINQVPNAKTIKSMCYQEAIELSYFNTQILDLRIIEVLVDFNINYLIRNIINVKSPGTFISNSNDNNHNNSIKGIFSLKDIVMLNFSIPILQNLIVVESRIVYSVSKHTVLLFLSIKKNHLEYIINFYIAENSLENVMQVLQKEFKCDFKNKLITSVEVIKNLGMISIVGDGIYNSKGLYKKIFSLISDNVNITNILTNHSKNSLSIVLNNHEVINAVKLIYNSLFVNYNSLFINYKTIEIFIIGIGGVGNALLNQIHRQQKYLRNQKQIKLSICGIANSQRSLINPEEINLSNWKLDFNKTKRIFNISEWVSLIKQNHMPNPVIVDCTASQEIANQYAELLSNGFSIVTSNKKANTSCWSYYQKIRNIANTSNRKFLYETNVGAGLPVIANLKNLLNVGDKLINFSGILSGSLSFIFGKLDEGLSLSEATNMAREMGFTEPDPREDLSGMDVARKLLILAREVGYKLELKDIIIEPLLPNDLKKIKDVNDFMEYLSKFDDLFQDRVSRARNHGKVLRFVGTIDQGGICKVKINEVEENNPLHKIKNGENALAFYSRYYQPIPLVLRGYGAGNDVTAAGVFADLLHTVS
ncbi:bifunctional aspartate kinase/homoserine dehydrogenase I [Candidatus Pantoea edessiphila]|uniref:Bifunctional aspartokinase/homoserine dehydrogenase n=1 Tax=Candidatus Pantoea edessiphila TaxID=2044610 RepID=A0A2P5T039_9GAMM|nr:bifunctional aspartate kinase/homoserine dehydrogenase I [Candidatus Pantoea edessiphila]PPI87947.1 bifunctional aspartate kinase/homoserine dehydrogenase I [Candidatus Pantoea edessiphila]